MATDNLKPEKQKNRVGLGGRKRHGIVYRLRGYFLAGLLTVAPIGLTVWLFWVLLKFVDSLITPLIPEAYNPNSYLHAVVPFDIPGVGLIVLIVALLFTVTLFSVTDRGCIRLAASLGRI